MKTTIKIGLSAPIAFAYLFAMSFTATAQEKEVTAADKTESVQASGPNVGTIVHKIATTNWYFQGTQQSQVFDADFWDTTEPSESCSNAMLTLPCLYETPIALVEPEELIEYLEDEYGTDASAVAAEATTRKAESPN